MFWWFRRKEKHTAVEDTSRQEILTKRQIELLETAEAYEREAKQAELEAASANARVLDALKRGEFRLASILADLEKTHLGRAESKRGFAEHWKEMAR